MIELLVVIAIIGILSVIAIQNVLRAVDNARTARTMADMQAVAKAVIDRGVQTNNYPTGTVPVAQIANLLRPFMGYVPTKDGWGHNLIYSFGDDEELDLDDIGESEDDDDDEEGEPTRAGMFWIISFGKDGTPDGAVVTGVWIDFNSDIVLKEGRFIQSRW